MRANRHSLRMFRRSVAQLPLCSIPLLAIVSAVMMGASCTATPDPEPVTYNAELAYLEAVNEAGPAVDPAVVFLLMAQYAESNREQTGIARMEALLNRYQADLSPERQAIYLAALGVLRATHAGEVPIFQRVGWVEETIAVLERAKQLSGGEVFVVRWAAGIVYARLPALFDMEETAVADLRWCLDHAERAPHAGWLREVNRHLARVYEEIGEAALSQEHLRQSGLRDLDDPITLTTAMAVGLEEGATFHPPRLREIVPGRVYALSGFEFTEYHFVLSADGQHLIAIDAGTRADSARRAYEHLRSAVPDLPPLTTVLVTHAHWDHVGGHRYFREAGHDVRFYARVNYQAELERITRVRVPFRYFFGNRFDLGAAIDFQAHETVSVRRQIVVGETPIELIPVEGGETEDGLFIHFPRERVLFTGDFIMPYLGAPFVEEGNLGGLLAAIDMVTALDPAFILHGHEPLTRVYGAATTLADLRVALSWLETEIRRGLREGATRAEIHRRNLIAPNVPQNPPVQVPYLVMREHVIDRIYDQTIGYWHPDLDGMDHLSPREWGAVLSQYLGIDESKLEGAVKDMISSGDAQAAARLVEWYSAYAPESERLRALRRAVYRHLAGKYQEIDPFRFIIYSERAGQEMTQLNQP